MSWILRESSESHLVYFSGSSQVLFLFLVLVLVLVLVLIISLKSFIRINCVVVLI